VDFLRRGILLFLVLLCAAIVSAQEEGETELDIDEMRQRILAEDSPDLMDYSLDDSAVSLFITGSWKGELQGNLGFSVSPVGTGFASPETPLLFKQEADLTLSLFINGRWFVEANFLDDSSQNTYRAGYQGQDGEFIKYAGIGNTGLDFPSYPYLDLGGDSPSSFGFYGRFGTPQLDIHTLFRYDSASREERNFYGGRERTYSDVQPQNSVRGISFVLPDTDIDGGVSVYIEDEKGTIRDTSGRRWRLALSSEYAVSRMQGLLELSVRPSGMVAISYTKNNFSSPWNNSMGSYDGSPNGFLTKVQNWFSPDRSIKLEDYPQCAGGASSPTSINIDGGNALVIYEPGTFSPFERRNRYDSPSSTTERAELLRLSSGTEIGGFELVRLETASFTDIPQFVPTVSRMAIYELVQTDSFSMRDPQTCWPLAQDYPQIYLPPSGVFTGDIILRFTNYNSVSGFYIGTDVIPGSIQVWRSGILDTNFSYNQSSGEVTIGGVVGQNELIRITYLKKSEGTQFGSIAAGIGANYTNADNNFSAEAAVGVRWNVTDDSYTEENSSSTGVVGIGAGVAWDYEFLKARITGGFAFVQSDTTGLYRAAGMEGHEAILSLSPELSFLSNPCFLLLPTFPQLTESTRANLIYRNFYDNTVLGSNLMNIDRNAQQISGINRPYPAKDSRLGERQVLVAEFDLSDEKNWTGFQVALNYDADLLSRAVELEIPFRFYDFDSPPSNFKLIVQIGSLSGKDFMFTENPALIWEKILFTNDPLVPIDPNAYYSSTDFNYNHRIVRFVLNDEDRLKLGDAKYLRIIAVYEGAAEIHGRVILASPIVRGSAFRAITANLDGDNSVKGNPENVTAAETMDSGASLGSSYGEIVNRFHSVNDTQRVLRIEWENMETGISAGVDGMVGELPLSDYRELSFFVKPRQAVTGNLSFIIASGPQSISERYFEARIPMTAFTEGRWSKVTIRYQGENTGVTVDGMPIPGAFSRPYKPLTQSIDNSARRTSYIAILISPEQSGTLENGTVYIDEIILEDAVLVYRMNAGAGIEYSKPGTIAAIGGVPVLADFSVYSAVESEARAKSEVEQEQIQGSVVSRTGAEISILGMKVGGNFAFTAAQETFLWSADHSLSRTFGPLSIGEKFYTSPSENSARHGVNIAFSSPFYAKFDADALYDFSRLRQKWNFDIGYRSQNSFIPSVALNTEAVWTRSGQIAEDENYGDIWVKSWSPLVPDIGSGANTRRTQSQFIITQRSTPVGAVLTLDAIAGFSEANNVTRSENSAFLDIPVTINRLSLNFRAGRGFKRHLYFSSQDVLDDGRKFSQSLEDCFILWGVFPGYSLFAPELGTAMDDLLVNSPTADIAFYTSFNDHFSARVNLPPVYNLASFFLPSRITFRIERILEQKLDTRVDMLTLGSSLGFSAINMFGAMGYLPIFKFYRSDEYLHGIEAAVIIPKDEEVSWRVSSILSASFRGFTGGTLNFTNTLTLRSTDYWIEGFVAGWESPVKSSLLSVFYGWIARTIETQSSWLTFSSLLNSDYEKLRKESLEIVFDKSTDYLRWSITAGHEDIIRILGRLNFTTFIKLRGARDLYTEIFIFDVLLGTTLRISF
jgi:hypothetical protein